MNCLTPSNHLKTEDRDSFPRKEGQNEKKKKKRVLN